MIILLKDKQQNDLSIEVMGTKTNKGKDFKGGTGNIKISGFLKDGQDFLTEDDIKIKGSISTSIEDIVDQLNEFMEEDY